MSDESQAPLPRRSRRRPARSTGERVSEVLQRLSGGDAAIIAQSETAWASITFAGTRHRFTLRFVGDEAIAGGEALIDALPDHEFTIPGQLVAEAAITSVEHTMLPQPQMTITAELLLLEEA